MLFSKSGNLLFWFFFLQLSRFMPWSWYSKAIRHFYSEQHTISQLSLCLRNTEPLSLARVPRIKLHFWWYRTLKQIGLKHSSYPKSEKRVKGVCLIAVKNKNWILNWIFSWGENKLNRVFRKTLVIFTQLSLTRILKLKSSVQKSKFP